MVDMVAAKDKAVEIIVEVNELVVVVEDCHPMRDGVMVDNIIQIVTIVINVFCTHCGRYRHTRENCWNLNRGPGNVPSATLAEEENPSGSNEQQVSCKVDSQHWKDELTNLRQRLDALEGAT